jgi:hypothetical protein
MEIKVEKAGIRFKNLDPEYARASTNLGFYRGHIEPNKVLSVRVTFETYNKLLLYAKNSKLSISEVVRRAIEEYLNKSGHS